MIRMAGRLARVPRGVAQDLVGRPGPWRVLLATILTITSLSTAVPLTDVPRLYFNLSIAGLVSAWACVLALAWKPMSPSRPERVALFGTLGLVLAALLSAVGSSLRGTALSQAAVLALMLVFVFGTAMSRWRPMPRFIEGDLSVVALVLSFWSLVSALLALLGVSFALGPFSRANGVFSNANYLGMVSAVSLSLTLALALQSSNRRRRWGILAVSLLLLVPLGLSGSRGAGVAAAAGVLVTLVAARQIRALITVGGALLVAAAVGAVLYSRIFERVPAGDPTSGRLDLWEHALDLWGDSPIFGVGYRTLELLPGSEGHAAHNVYLGVLVEAGVLGLAAILVTLIGILWWGGWSPLLGVVVTILVNELTESSMLGWMGPTALTFWLVLVAHGVLGNRRARASFESDGAAPCPGD